MECGDGSLRAQSRPFARSVAVGTAQASLPLDDARNESPALAVHFNPPGAPTAMPTPKVSTRHRKRVLRFGKLFGPRTLHGSVGTYQHFYNFARKNRSRANKTPVKLLREKAPNLHPHILLLHPCLLDSHMGQLLPEPAAATCIAGQHPRLPCGTGGACAQRA
jgi:hypothetical protein